MLIDTDARYSRNTRWQRHNHTITARSTRRTCLFCCSCSYILCHDVAVATYCVVHAVCQWMSDKEIETNHLLTVVSKHNHRETGRRVMRVIVHKVSLENAIKYNRSWNEPHAMRDTHVRCIPRPTPHPQCHSASINTKKTLTIEHKASKEEMARCTCKVLLASADRLIANQGSFSTYN